LRLERNYGEAIRLLQSRLAQLHVTSSVQVSDIPVQLALMQRLAGDTAGAKTTAERVRNTLEAHLYGDQVDDSGNVAQLSQVYAAMGAKDSALKEAERAIALFPSANARVEGRSFEENQAFIQMLCGDNSGAISTLTRLLQTPGTSWFYRPMPITSALLRLDPLWDPLRSDPAFQKLCEEKVDKSIAVLPFENLSRDPDNAYFAEGIQEEILTRLAKIADLKVISRTSTQRYQSKPDDVGEIAKQLGVANILEGSVQKTGDQVRVNVQLINAQTDSHLWADAYDRKLTDTLGVESEIAKRIAESLQAKLSGREEQALAIKPTNNPEAYDAYLRGLAFEARINNTISVRPDLVREAIKFYERAVQLDSDFANAWARLSRMRARRLPLGDSAQINRDAAREAFENAQKLQPDSPETLLALGSYQYGVLRDFVAAKATFERVSKILPSSSEALIALAEVVRGEGRWDLYIAYLERALVVDPQNVELLDNMAWTYTMLRQFPAALKFYDRALDLRPKDLDLMAEKASVYQAQGNLEGAASLLSEINWQEPNSETMIIKITQLRLERNYDEAVRLLQARLAQFRYRSEFYKSVDQLTLAFIQCVAGDRGGARASAEPARNAFEHFYKDEGGNYKNGAWLSQAYAVMGEKESALKVAERAVMFWPSSKDALNGPQYEENLALMQTIFGETRRAISTLSQLLKRPYNSSIYHADVTPALLRLDPLWDPLRSDPAFQKLCEEKQK
jgi:TolB-like protein/Tfp pilus assembly protein PilF